MTKRLKAIILVLVMVLGIVGTSTVAFAAESFKTVKLSSKWTTIAYDTDGFNCNVQITGYVSTGVGPRIDVQILGKKGNVVWSENNSCPGLASRVYHCVSDIYTIQVRVSNGISGSATALKTNKPAS